MVRSIMPHSHKLDDKIAEMLADLNYNPWKLSMKRCEGRMSGVVKYALGMSATIQRCRYPRYGEDKLCYYCSKKAQGLL